MPDFSALEMPALAVIDGRFLPVDRLNLEMTNEIKPITSRKKMPSVQKLTTGESMISADISTRREPDLYSFDPNETFACLYFDDRELMFDVVRQIRVESDKDVDDRYRAYKITITAGQWTLSKR